MTPETDWRRSTRCGSTTCVEVARDGADYLVRDSKRPDILPLRFTEAEWIAFLDQIRYGDFKVM